MTNCLDNEKYCHYFNLFYIIKYLQKSAFEMLKGVNNFIFTYIASKLFWVSYFSFSMIPTFQKRIVEFHQYSTTFAPK